MTDPQRTRVFEISEYLSKTDHDTICYLYKLPDSHKSCNASRLELLIKLEKLGKFSASRPESLEKVLNAIHRSDLVDIVKKDHCRSVEFASYRELCDQLAQAKLCYTQAKTAEEKLSACLLQKFKSLTPEGLEKRLNEVHRYLQAQVTSSERMADCSREMVARHSVAAAGRSEVAPGSPQGPGKVWQTRVRVLPPSEARTSPLPWRLGSCSPTLATQLQHSETCSAVQTQRREEKGDERRRKKPLVPPPGRKATPQPTAHCNDTANDDYDDVLSVSESRSTPNAVSSQEVATHYYASRDLMVNRPDLRSSLLSCSGERTGNGAADRMSQSAPTTPLMQRHFSATGSGSTLQPPLTRHRKQSKIPIPVQRQQYKSISEFGDYNSDSDYTGSCELTGSGSGDSGIEGWRGHRLTARKDHMLDPSASQDHQYTRLSPKSANDAEFYTSPVPSPRRS